MSNEKPISLGEMAQKVGISEGSVSLADIAEKIGYEERPISMSELDKAVEKYLKKQEK
ncbi:hypothetical protein [Microbulbifer sediminum]|uniref:hypothetical protein n=1 Tax=Microbulbifer sediminum TaxID=2904250 RepID=UPI001F24B66F|nr:hypothetical protein [Microbulbifer sediminum]